MSVLVIARIVHESVGDYTLEMSGEDMIVERIKEITAKIPMKRKDAMKLWEIRVVGGEKIPPKIRKLIQQAEDDETPDDVPPLDEGPLAHLHEAQVAAEAAASDPRPVRRQARRARPGGPIKA